MRLSSLFIVIFGIGVVSYPVIYTPHGALYFADKIDEQAEPAPRPEGGKEGKTDFAYRIIINIPATKLIALATDQLQK